jgi:hypothetical protein
MHGKLALRGWKTGRHSAARAYLCAATFASAWRGLAGLRERIGPTSSPRGDSVRSPAAWRGAALSIHGHRRLLALVRSFRSLSVHQPGWRCPISITLSASIFRPRHERDLRVVTNQSRAQCAQEPRSIAAVVRLALGQFFAGTLLLRIRCRTDVGIVSDHGHTAGMAAWWAASFLAPPLCTLPRLPTWRPSSSPSPAECLLLIGARLRDCLGLLAISYGTIPVLRSLRPGTSFSGERTDSTRARSTNRGRRCGGNLRDDTINHHHAEFALRDRLEQYEPRGSVSSTKQVRKRLIVLQPALHRDAHGRRSPIACRPGTSRSVKSW